MGSPVTDCKDDTFYFIFDEPIDKDADLLITVDVNGHEYGIVSPASSRADVPGCIKLYFTLSDGKQTDFVDRVKVEDPESAKCDLSEFTGTALMSLYVTDKQVEGTYPTGRMLVKRKTLPIANA